MNRRWSQSLYFMCLAVGILWLQACVAHKAHHTNYPNSSSPTSSAEAYRPQGSYAAPRSRAQDSGASVSSAPRPSVAGKSYGASPSPYSYQRNDSYRRYQQHRSYQHESRPGLGTAYGRTLYSTVRQVHFQRQSSSPSAVLQVHYNNPSGVYAMARYLGGVPCCGSISSTSGAGVSVRLTDAYGRSLRGLHSGGKIWVMGQHGARYRIHVQNYSNRRVEIVASVDGLDVIDGKRASYHKRGYIVLPYGNLWIDGFRRSFHAVAAFQFSSVSQSYAARTSGDRNVGVVGVAVFPEVLPQWNADDLYRRQSASPFAQPPQE